MHDNPSILIVDDQPDHRLLLASGLKEAMPEVRLHEVAGTTEALEAVSSQRFDAVLCDFRFGATTGLDLLRAIRSRGLDVAFLLVTNHGSEEVARQAFVEGVADYVTKQQAIRNPADLARRVRRAVDKRRLTEEHDRAEALLESFLENNPYAVLIFDPSGRLVRWNRAPVHMENLTEDLERFRATYSPFEDRQLSEAGVLDRFSQALAGQWMEIPPFPWDPSRAGLSGSTRILRGVAFPIEIKGDDAPHLCAMIQDVTEEETTRRERDEYAAILASLLNASRAAILFVDLDFKVRFANRYVKEFFGIEPAAIIGRPRRELAEEVARSTTDPGAFLERLRYLDANPEVEADEMVEVARPRRRHLRRHSGPVRGPANRVLGRIEVYVDETESIEKQHLLEEQNRELDVFASRLAHDLKTPLVSLAGFADLLERQQGRQLGAQGQLYLEKVRASASLLGEMVDGLRELAQAGAEVECPAGVDPLPVLRLVCETLDDLAAERDVEIAVPSRVPGVLCDRAQLYQIFDNLISNAVRYSDPEEPKRWVRIEAEEFGGEVRIQVRDNGLGIDEAEQREVFQPFRRGLSASESAGMGLGLAITQRIVKACGGHVELASVPSEGTCITVILPRHPTWDDAEAHPESP